MIEILGLDKSNSDYIKILNFLNSLDNKYNFKVEVEVKPKPSLVDLWNTWIKSEVVNYIPDKLIFENVVPEFMDYTFLQSLDTRKSGYKDGKVVSVLDLFSDGILSIYEDIYECDNYYELTSEEYSSNHRILVKFVNSLNTTITKDTLTQLKMLKPEMCNDILKAMKYLVKNIPVKFKYGKSND